jgi:glycosyltransferase involved in cell wall biosynthesis
MSARPRGGPIRAAVGLQRRRAPAQCRAMSEPGGENRGLLDLVVVMPVYNEQDSIGNVLSAWSAVLGGLGLRFEIHVYNDGSKDETGTRLEDLRATVPGVIVHSKRNSGHGSTIRQGYLENMDRAQWLFQVDSDDEMGPDWFYKLWNIRHDHDFVTGRRYERRSSLSRKVVSLAARLAVNLAYGPCVYDVNCPYRLMRVAAFRECYLSLPPATFAPNVLISGYCAYHEIKTVEIHVPHRSRYSGTVSIRKWKLVKESLRSMYQTVRYRFTDMPRHRGP